MKVARLKIPTIVLAVVALVVGVSSGAVAAKLITGKDIKDNTVTSADIKNGTLATKDLKQNGVNGNRLQKGTVNGAKLQPGSVGNGKIADGAVTSNKIADGTIGPNDLSTTAFGPTWSIVDRNVIGNGDSYLRSGPSSCWAAQLGTPPLGVGSLGIRTGSGTDKAAFGDQVDFSGDPFQRRHHHARLLGVHDRGEHHRRRRLRQPPGNPVRDQPQPGRSPRATCSRVRRLPPTRQRQPAGLERHRRDRHGEPGS